MNNNLRRIDIVFTSIRYLERCHHRCRHSTWLASRSRLYSTYKRQIERLRFLFSFLFFRRSVHPRLYITLAPFFLHLPFPPVTRAIVEFQRSTSFRNSRQWRRGFAGTKTFLRRLKNHSTRSSRPETENSSASLFRPIPYSRRRAGSRYRTRSRSFVRAARGPDMVNSWILLISGSEIKFGKLR